MNKRFGQRAFLKPDKIDEYMQLHANTWPSVREVIADSHLVNYSIYIMDNEVVSYFEYDGDDYEKDMERMAQAPAMQEWWTHTKPCFEGHEKNEYYLDMQEIFHQE